MSDFADVVENRTDFGIFERAPQRGINYAAYPATCSARSFWVNGFAAVSGKLVDHICDPPIARTDEDDGVVAILNEERMGLCLRHFVPDFRRHRV